MPFKYITLLFCTQLLLCSSSSARELRYNVDLKGCKSHQVHVTLKPIGFTRTNATFQIPAWAPGAYSLTHYGHYIMNFKAFDKFDHNLKVSKINEDRWEIESDSSLMRIEYDVLDSHNDKNSLFFAMSNIDSSFFFANGTCLFGYLDDDKNASSIVEYTKPPEWSIVCPLPPSKKGFDSNHSFRNTVFFAKDFDILVDAPVMASNSAFASHSTYLLTTSFKEGSATYDIVVATEGNFNKPKLDSLSVLLQKIVLAETSFFHETPFVTYTFFIYCPEVGHLSSSVEGALEHSNSSAYLLSNISWQIFKSRFSSIFSHEFFHLWNVKRIHSSLLGPFDYTKKVITTSLWLSESITEYYAKVLLIRYVVTDPRNFYTAIEQWINEYKATSGFIGEKSLEDVSKDESSFNLNEDELLYSKGALVAMMLDIEIREKTNNEKSLDDVMLRLNQDAKLANSFSDDSLIQEVERYSGVNLNDFYNRYIRGTDSLPIDRYLSLAGILRKQEVVTKPSARPHTISMDSTGIIVFLDTTKAIAIAGLRKGDRIDSINGVRRTFEGFVELMSSMDDTMTVVISRGGKSIRLYVVNTMRQGDKHPVSPIQIDPNASSLAIAIRKGITGGR